MKPETQGGVVILPRSGPRDGESARAWTERQSKKIEKDCERVRWRTK
jgi:hypothetical protein